MTDRHKGYVVALSDDVREDDAEKIINAIRMVKGVLRVEAVEAERANEWIVEERVRSDLSRRLWEVLHPTPKDGRR